MKIDRLDVYYVEMPLIYPWRTAYGEDYEIHSVLVKAQSGEHTAWSESTPFFAPTYLPESAGTVFYHVTEVFGPHVVGREYETAQDLNDRLAVFKGNSVCEGGGRDTVVDAGERHHGDTGAPSAWAGRRTRWRRERTLGSRTPSTCSWGTYKKAVDTGFPRIKLKAAPGWDLDMLKAVTSTFPNMTFHIDCNSGYTLDDLPFFKAIDDMGLAFIEQPLHYADVLDHAELARQIQTPICLDETIVSVKAAEQAVQVGAAQYINIKPGRIGGLSNALAVHDLCRDAGVPVWVGGMLESALGGALCVEVATAAQLHVSGRPVPFVTVLHARPVGSADGVD